MQPGPHPVPKGDPRGQKPWAKLSKGPPVPSLAMAWLCPSWKQWLPSVQMPRRLGVGGIKPGEDRVEPRPWEEQQQDWGHSAGPCGRQRLWEELCQEPGDLGHRPYVALRCMQCAQAWSPEPQALFSAPEGAEPGMASPTSHRTLAWQAEPTHSNATTLPPQAPGSQVPRRVKPEAKARDLAQRQSTCLHMQRPRLHPQHLKPLTLTCPKPGWAEGCPSSRTRTRRDKQALASARHRRHPWTSEGLRPHLLAPTRHGREHARLDHRPVGLPQPLTPHTCPWPPGLLPYPQQTLHFPSWRVGSPERRPAVTSRMLTGATEGVGGGGDRPVGRAEALATRSHRGSPCAPVPKAC